MMEVHDELIDRMLEGDVSEEEAAEFETWLEDPANLRYFARRAELHVDLRRSLNRRNIQAVALDRCGESEQSSPQSSTATVARLPRHRVAMLVGLAVAASLLFAFLPRGGQDALPSAIIVKRVDALLTRDDQLWNAGELSTGRYELKRGLMNLRFGGNVLVYVEAPARFDAVTDSRVVLHAGRLSAKVPPEGVGFTVETPEAEVVDFGTEFSVDVESGASEVHVFDGLVRVQPRSLAEKESKAVDLKTSQAVRIAESATTPVDIPIARDRFIRDFDERKGQYPRLVRKKQPLAYYRMPIRDRGLVCEPPDYSGVVLTGEGNRPPHARGVLRGGSLRVKADSAGRGGRVDTSAQLETGQMTLVVFVYLEEQSASDAIVATNLSRAHGNFELSVDSDGLIRATIRGADGELTTVRGTTSLSPKTWLHVVMTTNGNSLALYEDGQAVASAPCDSLADSLSKQPTWFGTDGNSTHLWNGRLDEVAIFDRALTQQDVSELFQNASDEIAGLR